MWNKTHADTNLTKHIERLLQEFIGHAASKVLDTDAGGYGGKADLEGTVAHLSALQLTLGLLSVGTEILQGGEGVVSGLFGCLYIPCH